VLGAAVALRLPEKRNSPQAIACEVLLETSQGLRTAWVLIDSGAESNFINQKWTEQYYPDSPSKPRKVKALDGRRIRAYGQHKLSVHAEDADGLSRNHTHVFEAVDMDGYDMILGFPWLQATNPDIDWVQRTWRYRDLSDMKVSIITAQKAAKIVHKGNSAFVVTIHTIFSNVDNPDILTCGTVAALDGPPISNEYRDFIDVFSKEKGESLPEHSITRLI
jgi:hypothetical protein